MDPKLSQQTADKINPCPFCGGKADDIGGNECYITCKKCIVGNTVFIENWNKANSLVSEGGKQVPRIVVSCWSCRKNKGCLDTLSAQQLISCKYRFGAWEDEPCENWLPGKETIRIKIMRAVEGIHDIDTLRLETDTEITKRVILMWVSQMPKWARSNMGVVENLLNWLDKQD